MNEKQKKLILEWFKETYGIDLKLFDLVKLEEIILENNSAEINEDYLQEGGSGGFRD